MSKTCVNCVLKFQLFFLNLSGKILADLDLELQLFNVMELCAPTVICKFPGLVIMNIPGVVLQTPLTLIN